MKYELKSVAELENWLEEHPLAVVHIYRETCSVCHAVLPQLEAFIDHYPGCLLYTSDAADELSEV